jgi:predicted RND superfamily exporter protein
VIVIPLLLGMGIDSGIHLVHRSLHRHAEEPPEGLAATHTARAVFYSALTTITSFGSLAFSSHRGLSDLGVLLVVGMLLTLACNLLVLPALIRLYLLRHER